MRDRTKLFIGGEWKAPASGRSFTRENPATRDVYATVADGSREDAERAIAAAQAAFAVWRRTLAAERGRLLTRAAEILEARQHELALQLVTETGSTFGKAMFEVGYTAGMLRYAAATAYQPAGEILQSQVPGKTNMVVRSPVGVVSVISPWNFPLLLSMRGVAFSVAYGNTVVLKPSELSPVSGGMMIADVFAEAGFPTGVLNVVSCSRDSVGEVGDVLVSHPAVRRISFTGSTETGRIVAVKAAQHLKRAILELGGKDPVIILADADLDYAVNAAAFGSFFHQGQICMSTERLIVERGVADEFTRRLGDKARALRVGNPADPQTQIGPIINQSQLDKIQSQVNEAAAAGASIVCGGNPDGLYYPPTVLIGVTPRMRVFREETFGPVAPIVVVDSEEEAVTVANDSAYGLSAGVITSNEQRGLAIAERLESGMVHVNDSSVHDEPHCPFGGTKDSGLGRHGGQTSIYEFTETRWISLQHNRRQYPF